jgi:hypothetical protein
LRKLITLISAIIFSVDTIQLINIQHPKKYQKKINFSILSFIDIKKTNQCDDPSSFFLHILPSLNSGIPPLPSLLRSHKSHPTFHLIFHPFPLPPSASRLHHAASNLYTQQEALKL